MTLDVEINVREPLLHVEARTRLLHPRQVAVTDDLRLGIVRAEAPQKLLHRLLLRLRARVGGIAVPVESALVADTYGAGVVAAGMGACLLLGAAGIDHAVAGDVIMIADTSEAARPVARLQCLHGEILVLARGGTVNDD